MEPEWPAGRIREEFVKFFKSKLHEAPASSPVVTEPGPGLPRRGCNSQKCIRAGDKDLEQVGNDTYHHTFMEMLGNWSFGGEYFKAEAIEYAYELLTQVYQLPVDKIYVTYFGGDDEMGLSPDNTSKDAWLTYVPKERVLPFGVKDNFWEMSNTGLCGPCSKIYFDCVGSHAASSVLNKDDHSCVQLWNLVFIEFNRQSDGTVESLPEKKVTTGMSIELLTSILQNKMSNYDTDVFKPLFDAIHKIVGTGIRAYSDKVGPADTDRVDMAYRIVADHLRAISFAISDGSGPGNEGANYAVRLMIRRAVYFGRFKLGAEKGFFNSLVQPFVQVMGEVFPELKSKEEKIQVIIKDEEICFEKTLKEGHTRFMEAIQSVKDRETGAVLSGQDAFDMWDNYGYPIGLTKVMANEIGIDVDTNGFKVSEEEANRKATDAWKMGATIFCSECGVLMLNEKDIARHLQDTNHKNLWASASKDHYVYCMKCKENFSSVIHLEKHNDMYDEDHIIFMLMMPPKHEKLTGYTTPSVKRNLADEITVERIVKRRKVNPTAIPFSIDSDEDTDDERALYCGEVEGENPYSDHESDDDDDKDDDQDDDDGGGGDDDDDDDDDDELADPSYDPDLKKDQKAKLHEPEDSSSSRESSSIRPPFEARTLRNLILDASARKALRKRYIIAEAVTTEVALRRVERALENYNKFKYFTRRRKSVIYEPELHQLCLSRTTAIYKCSEAKGQRLLKLFVIIRNLLLQVEGFCQRENQIHYQYCQELNEDLMDEHLAARISRGINDISAIVKVSRESLRIRPSSKGLIKGAAKLFSKEGLLVDCNLGGSSGNSIPSEADCINKIDVKPEVKYVLVIEKDTVFHHLTERNFHVEENCILVTGKGHPDVATRILLRKLRIRLPDVPFYAIVDGNPSGAVIFCTYRYGSSERCHDLLLTVHDIHFIGLHVGNVEKKHLTALSEPELEQVDKILKKTYIPHEGAMDLRSNLLLMTERGKADIEVLMQAEGMVQYIKTKIAKYGAVLKSSADD